MVLFPHFCCLNFNFPWKLLLLFAVLLICLSSPPPTVKHDRPEPPPHHSSFLLPCLQDESLSVETNLCESFLHTEPKLASLLLVGLFAAFSDLFIHWWLLHLTPVKKFIPSFCMCVTRPPNLIWNMHRCMNLFIVEEVPLFILESLISRGALVWKRPTCHLPNGAPLSPCNDGGKGNDLAPTGGLGQWLQSSMLSEALTSHLPALDVRPVMSLWRVPAVPARKLHARCMDAANKTSAAPSGSVKSRRNVFGWKQQCDKATAAVSL